MTAGVDANAGTTSLEEAIGNFKIVNADKIIDPIPAIAKLQQGDVPYSAGRRQGRLFRQPIVMSDGQAYTATGKDGDAFNLVDPQPTIVKEADVYTYSAFQSNRVTVESIWQSGDTNQAFENQVNLVLKSMTKVMRTNQEMSAWYGQSGVGVVEGSPVNTSGSVWTVVLSAASFARGWWPQKLTGRFQFFNGTSIRGSSLYGRLDNFNLRTRTLTFTVSGTGMNTVADGDDIWLFGTYGGTTTFYEQVGLFEQITGTDDFFGLDRDDYPVVTGNTLDADGNPMSSDLLVQAITDAKNRGLEGGLRAYVPTVAYNKLWSEVASTIRRLDPGMSKEKSIIGSRNFMLPTENGDIEVVEHELIKDSHTAVLPMESVVWTGATRGPQSGLPNAAGVNNLFYPVPNTNYLQFNLFNSAQIFDRDPSWTTWITGLDNS
jgi:hypothetical protein